GGGGRVGEREERGGGGIAIGRAHSGPERERAMCGSEAGSGRRFSIGGMAPRINGSEPIFSGKSSICGPDQTDRKNSRRSQVEEASLRHSRSLLLDLVLRWTRRAI